MYRSLLTKKVKLIYLLLKILINIRRRRIKSCGSVVFTWLDELHRRSFLKSDKTNPSVFAIQTHKHQESLWRHFLHSCSQKYWLTKWSSCLIPAPSARGQCSAWSHTRRRVDRNLIVWRVAGTWRSILFSHLEGVNNAACVQLERHLQLTSRNSCVTLCDLCAGERDGGQSVREDAGGMEGEKWVNAQR